MPSTQFGTLKGLLARAHCRHCAKQCLTTDSAAKVGRGSLELAELNFRIPRLKTIRFFVSTHGPVVDGQAVLACGGVGMLVAEYYTDPENLLDVVNRNGNVEEIIPRHILEG